MSDDLSARFQELFWALPSGTMRHKLRSLEIDIGRTLRDVRESLDGLTPGHKTGYDWNADPLSLTLVMGRAYDALAALRECPAPAQPRTDLLRALAAIPRYRMTLRYGFEVRCEVIETPGVGEWVRMSDVLQVAAHIDSGQAVTWIEQALGGGKP
jgi:hypothetical protein